MKILIVGPEYDEKGGRFQSDIAWSFHRLLQQRGHAVDFFAYKKRNLFAFIEKNKGVKAWWHRRMNRDLVRRVVAERPDLMIVFKGGSVEAEALWEIRNRTPTVMMNLFPDNPLHMMPFRNIEPYHFFFIKDSYALAALTKIGFQNVRYLPHAADPDVCRPVALTPEEQKGWGADLSLVGSHYPYRGFLMRELQAFDLKIWGKGWASLPSDDPIRPAVQGRSVWGEEKTKVVCGSKISLNPHHPLNDITGINDRTFEIAACGGFQLLDRKADLEKHFKIGEEIIAYNDKKELLELIRYYLDHEETRRQIAERAYRRVLKDHTVAHRVDTLLSLYGADHG
ncbi:MAG: glycosyltransferase [Nitrospirae bacterium]|nr:glycosyltransferase [Candidatus Manganitrophaceae bacterium]